jgi:hypothetical protein
VKHVYRIGFALLLYALAVYIYTSARQKEEKVVHTHTFDPAAFRAVDWFPGHGFSPEEKRTYLEAVERRVKELVAMELEMAKRDRAAQQMATSRRQAQMVTMMAWSSVIKTNYPAFLALRHKAASSPDGTTPCTICDGFSYMPCVMCSHRDGKCITCKGTGKRAGGEYCPSCSGDGKCYLCTGSGKMFCPFCDDGMIDVKWPMPTNFPPPG